MWYLIVSIPDLCTLTYFDIVESSDSLYCSPVLIVKKKDKSNRFCIYFCALNTVTVFDAEPMPNMEEIFTKIAGYNYISKLDLTRGYWQVASLIMPRNILRFSSRAITILSFTLWIGYRPSMLQ